MSRIPEHLKNRLKKGMNIPKTVEMQIAPGEKPYTYTLRAVIKVEVGDDLTATIKNNGVITKIETAEKLLALALPKMQRVLKEKALKYYPDHNFGINWELPWYEPPKPLRRTI